MSTPHVDEFGPDGAVKAVALMLHGGRQIGRQPVSGRQLSVLRMGPFTRELQQVGRDHGLAVWQMRYRVRGWNGTDASPVRDASEVLGEIRERHPGLPVALVGYSMGGRTALRIAGDDAVRTVVALAPWITDEEDPAVLTGRNALFLHGARDHTTDARRTAAFAAAARSVGASTGMVSIRRDGHSMLRRASLWHRLTVGFVLGGLGLAAMPEELATVLDGPSRPVEL